MVIMTAKVSKSKLIAIALIVLVAVILLTVCLTGSGKKSGASVTEGAPQAAASELKTNDDRIAYLAAYGWEVSQEPVQTQEVRIPTEPSEVFERYNDLQISQGFDLHDYAGKSVRRYVYQISNYPDTEDDYYATLLIYKGAVIGGDVSSSAQGGVMHSLCMPK